MSRPRITATHSKIPSIMFMPSEFSIPSNHSIKLPNSRPTSKANNHNIIQRR
jgi:hypothetical protein